MLSLTTLRGFLKVFLANVMDENNVMIGALVVYSNVVWGFAPLDVGMLQFPETLDVCF